MAHQKIAVYGAGGFAREVAWLAQECSMDVVCFIDDDERTHGTEINGIPSMGLTVAYQRFPEAKITVGVGAPKIREELTNKAIAAGFEIATLIHPRAERSEWIEIGDGVAICAGSILTTNIKLGINVQINLDCTIGHDVVMDDYATLAPGVHVSGCVQFGKRTYVGTGAVIINGTSDNPIIIGDDAVIGAGSCVTKSVDTGITVVGVPARPLARH